MRDLNPKKDIEKLRTQSGKDTDREIAELKKSAKENTDLLEKMDVSIEDVMAMPKLKANIEPEKQTQGLYAVEQIIGGLMARLKEKKEDIDLTQLSAGTLLTKALNNGVKIHLFERTAIEKYNELTRQSGPTGQHLQEAWQEITSNAHEKSKKWTEELEDMWKRDKAGTIGLLAVGAVGAYLGYKAIKGIWSWMTKNETPETLGKSSEKGFFESLMPSKKTMGLLGVLLLGLFLGRGELKKLLYAKLGIKLGDADLDDIAEKMKDGKLKEAEERIAALEAAAAAKAVEGKDKANQAGEKVSETFKADETPFETAKFLFKKLYFYDSYTFGDKMTNIDSVLFDLKDEKIKVSELITLYEKHKTDEKIPAKELPVKAHGLKPVHLFMILAGIVDVHKRFYGEGASTETVESLFIRSVKDPVNKVNEVFHEEVINTIKNGNIAEALGGLNYEKIGEKLKNLKGDFIDKLNEGSKKYEHLSRKEKWALREIQIQLFLKADLGNTPEYALRKAMSAYAKTFQAHDATEAVRKAAKDFFVDTKEKIVNDLGPKCVRHFGIKEIGGREVPNHIAQGLDLKELSFSHAVELLVVSKGVRWNEAEKGKIHWMKDLALLSVILRAMDKNSRDKYVGLLSRLAWESPTTINLSLPALANLRPYLSKVINFGKNKALNAGNQTLAVARAWIEGQPSKSPDFKKQIDEMPAYQLIGSEAAGGGAEFLTDTLAMIVATAGITPEELSATGGNQGEELLENILSKGGNVVYNKENPGTMAIELYGEWFFARPWGTFIETLERAVDLDFGGAIKTYAVGTSPFVVIGAGLGALKGGIPGMVKGALKGSIPLYGPYLGGYKIPKAVGTVAATAYQGGKEYIKRPLRKTSEAFNWTKAKLGRSGGLRSQSLTNLLRNAKDLKYFQERSNLAGLTLREKMWEWPKSPGKAFTRLASTFNEKMAYRYASQFATDYNDFFRFGEAGIEGRLVVDAKNLNESLVNLNKKAADRFARFIEQLLNDEKHLKEIAELAKKHRGLELEEGLTKIFASLQLSDEEAIALSRQLKTEKDVQKFAKRITKDGSKFLKKLSLLSKEKKLLANLAKEKNLEKIQKMLKKTGIKAERWHAELISEASNTDEVKWIIEEAKEAERAAKQGAEIGTAESRLAKLKKAIGEKTGRAKEKLSDVYKNVAKRFDRYAQAEGNLQKMLANAEADMTTIEKAIARANKMKNAAKAEELLSKASEAKKEMEKLVAKLNELKRAEEAMKSAKGSTEAWKASQKAVEAAMESSQKAFKAINESSKLIKALKFLKGGGKALIVAGPVVGAWSSGSHFYEAVSTDNVEKVGMEATMGGVYLANTAIDTAFVMTMFGKGGAGTKLLGRAWVPAMPIIYSAEKMYEVAEERVRSEAEWLQSYPYDGLIHQWFTTYHGVNLGESWISGFKADRYPDSLDKEVDKGIEEKRKIMHRMFKALIAAHKNPEIYNIMFDENKKQGAKNYEINEAIEKSYTKYHEYYFQHSIATSVKNYGAAKQFIADAQLFDDLMHMREEKKRAGGELKFVNEGTVYDLMDERYDITGTSIEPRAKRDFAPYLLIDAYKNHLLTFDKTENPHLEENLENMDTFYLLRLYVQIHKVTEDPEAQQQLADNPDMLYAMREYATMIRNYLVAKRSVHWKIALNNPKLFEPPMALDEVLTNLNDMDVKNSPSYQQFEKNIPEESRKPGLYAMYRLAEYFGYTGDADEATIKEFFCEEKEEFHGIYWDGSEWHMFNPGLSFDLTLDEQDMNKEEFIQEVVERFYQNSNDVLGYRHRSFMVSATEFIHDAQCFNFAYQIRSMAEILQNGYNEAIRKFHKGRKEIGHIAPQSFESQEPKESEHFEQEYTAEIKRIKEGMNWSQLDFEVKDQNTILLKRLDYDATTTIKKSGDTWNIESYATNLTFAQAVSMGNLLNWVKGESAKHHWVAGAKRPFEVDGGDIDFDKAGIIDTEVLDADRNGNWVKFYEKIGLPAEKMVEILNNWWEKEKMGVTI